MAARTSSSIGVGITVTLLSIATLGFFITSLVFYAQRRSALDAKIAAENTTKDFVQDTDRSDAQVQRIQSLASKDRKSVVRYMLEERRDLMTKVTGSDRDTVESIAKVLTDEKASSVLSLLRNKTGEIDSLRQQLGDANSARERALADKTNESNRVADIEAAQQKTVAALSEQVNITKSETEKLREDTNAFKGQMDERVEKIRNDYAAKEGGLKAEIEKLQAERAVDKDRLKRFEQELKGQRFAGQAEYALPDALVVGTTPADGTVLLSVGRKDKVVLGLSFNIYGQGTTIKPDEKTGEYPPGKATVEIIRVDSDSSVARILREQKGNPVLRGDFASNPVYDPTKKYKFLVYGSFDPGRTGQASPLAAGEVKAWIRDWGGDVSEELSGDVDFLVLGQRPQLPPRPTSTAPTEVISFFLAQERLANRYDELFKQATDTAIPVLNENRLRTLMGR